ncbi:MAG: cytochrome b/b6 domain-containing protein [Gemmataceae bacterium]
MTEPAPQLDGHPGWVRVCHWLVTVSFLALTVSGYVILMCHPRLYWGDAGNDLTPALFELPISRNYRHGGWEVHGAFALDGNGPVSATRTYLALNHNSWARSLHFLAAWGLVVPGTAYLVAGVSTGHFRRRLWPGDGELTPGRLWRDAADHLRTWARPAGSGYGLLQKCAYCGVVFVALPVVVLSGLAMSPAITAGYPALGRVFGGFQSARTVHYFAAVVLVLFLVVHIVMVARSGFWRQVRAMTIGGTK